MALNTEKVGPMIALATLLWGSATFLASFVIGAQFEPRLIGIENSLREIKEKVDKIERGTVDHRSFELWLERARRGNPTVTFPDTPK